MDGWFDIPPNSHVIYSRGRKWHASNCHSTLLTVLPGIPVQAAPLNPKHGDEHKAATPLVDGRKVMGLPAAAVSGTAYCFASGSMVLLNKAALSSFSFDAPTCLLFFQCAVCVLLVRLASLFGLVKLEPWSWKIARVNICTA